MLAAEIAVPSAYGRPLGNGPLLGGLPAGTDDAPDVVPSPRRAHGFQMDINSAASQAGAYGMGVQFFHAGDCISRAREEQAGNAPISRKFLSFCTQRLEGADAVGEQVFSSSAFAPVPRNAVQGGFLWQDARIFLGNRQDRLLPCRGRGRLPSASPPGRRVSRPMNFFCGAASGFFLS